MPARQYAHQTKVTRAATMAELEALLGKYGCVSFTSGTDQGDAIIAFELAGLRVLMRIALPGVNDRRFTHTDTGRNRHTDTVHAEHQAAIRATWRALLLFVKAKLVAVDQGLTTIEQEFLPYVLLPDGSTFSHHVLPEIRKAYATGVIPALIPGPTRPAIEGN